MSTLILFLNWHYLCAPKKILEIWRNFIRFVFNFFSISLLAKTWISHWKRYRYSYSRKISIGKNISNFIFNIFSRLMGIIIRTPVIVLGLGVEILVLGLGVISLAAWFFLPLLLVLGFVEGINLL